MPIEALFRVGCHADIKIFVSRALQDIDEHVVLPLACPARDDPAMNLDGFLAFPEETNAHEL